MERLSSTKTRVSARQKPPPAQPPRSVAPAMKHILGLQSTIGNRAVGRMVSAGNRSFPQVQRFDSLSTQATREKAIHYLNLGLAKQPGGLTWDGVKDQLMASEKEELANVWRGLKKGAKTPALLRAGDQMAAKVITMLATVNDFVAYSNNFDTKHVADPFDANAGVTLGNARTFKPSWSTAFAKKYFVDTLTTQAAGRADGNGYQWIGIAWAVTEANLALGERRADNTYKKAWVPIFQFTVYYNVATVGRTRTITATHLETA